MNNIKNDFLIGAITFILCIIIALLTSINFFWILFPIVIIILLAVLSKLLTARFGKTYGIISYFVILIAVPLAWYIFSSNMTMTARVLETQKEAKDLSSFQNYDPGIDSKKEIATYQMNLDSVVKKQVDSLLKENKVDEALKLVKNHESNTEKVKQELFNRNQSSDKKEKVNSSDNNSEKQTKVEEFGGKVAVINDPDGYTNVRSGQGTNFNILGIVREGEYFFAKPTNTDWWLVKTNKGTIGYMHKSRIRFIK